MVRGEVAIVVVHAVPFVVATIDGVGTAVVVVVAGTIGTARATTGTATASATTVMATSGTLQHMPISPHDKHATVALRHAPY